MTFAVDWALKTYLSSWEISPMITNTLTGFRCDSGNSLPEITNPPDWWFLVSRGNSGRNIITTPIGSLALPEETYSTVPTDQTVSKLTLSS